MFVGWKVVRCRFLGLVWCSIFCSLGRDCIGGVLGILVSIFIVLVVKSSWLMVCSVICSLVILFGVML